ncbi:MAG: DUF5320 domain-containing protein [Phycisphaerae bacterium]|nr:DUF5320 domain-containing protein [Phycisphaerae bacterium]
MPGGDRTGPMGAGPMTGRGAGYCAGYGMPGYTGRGFGRGLGGGRGFGRGWHRGMGARFHAWWQNTPVSQPDPIQERQMLEQEAAYLKNQVEQIQNRLNELGESS